MIGRCTGGDFSDIHEIINDAARAYEGVIPADCWKEPYMSEEELSREIDAGVEFWGYREGDKLVGVMGIQHVRDVTLIRHAYVRTRCRNKGVGGKLLNFLRDQTGKPILMAPGPTRSGRSASMKNTVFAWRAGRKKRLCCGNTGPSRRGRWRPRWCWWKKGRGSTIPFK